MANYATKDPLFSHIYRVLVQRVNFCAIASTAAAAPALCNYYATEVTKPIPERLSTKVQSV
jgi:hypothetical protein